jgi:hypothetical protein
MATWSAVVLSDARRATPEDIATEAPPARPCATLLLCRRLVESALWDAAQMCDGKPTQVALDAEEWINQRTDWTLRKPVVIPDAATRALFPGTFEWCCRWLGEDPDHVRVNGLPPLIARIVSNHSHRPMVSRRRREGGRHGQKHLRGMPDVYAIRERKTTTTYTRHRQRQEPVQASAASVNPYTRIRMGARGYQGFVDYCHFIGYTSHLTETQWRILARG